MRQTAVYYRLPGALLFGPAKGGTWEGDELFMIRCNQVLLILIRMLG